MNEIFHGPFARWAWSVATGNEDEPVFVGTSSAWIYNSDISSPDVHFKGKEREKNHFFNILLHEQLRQDGES